MPRTFTRAMCDLSTGLRIALLTPMLLGHAAQASPPTLCQADETIWFSCPVGPTKIVSLCGTRETLQYRFGAPQRLELRYPSPASGGYTAFRWAHHARFQADRTEVSFSNRGVDYTLFDYMEAGRQEAGVEVASGRRLRCVTAPHSQLAKLKDKLPCDADNALNLGRCPSAAD